MKKGCDYDKARRRWAEGTGGAWHMMASGICGMIGESIVKLIRGDVDAFDWMVFGIWAIVAVCGAIREATPWE